MTIRESTRRVLVLTYSHARIGGIETWLDAVACGLLRHDWSVCVASAWGAQHNDPSWRETASPTYELRRLDGRTGTQRGRVRAIARAVLQVQPDIVLPVGLADAYAGISRARRAGWAGHAVAALHAGSAAHIQDLTRHMRVLSAVGCVNETHAKVLRARFRGQGPTVTTCPNGVRLPPTEAPPLLARSNGTLRLLFVGRLEQVTKRILDVPIIAEKLHRAGHAIRVTIVGDGPDRGALEGEIARLDLGAHVGLLGAQSHDAVQSLYRSHHITLLCSSTEAAPLAPLEGMAWGVVPVTSSFPGWRGTGYLSHLAGTQCFPPGDLDRAAELIARLACDEEMRLACAGAAARHARGFGEDACVARWCSLLRSVAATPPPKWASSDSLQCGPPAGRLDAWLSPAAAESVRRWLRRFPRRSDGWAEWPGTESAATADATDVLRAEIEARDAWATPEHFQPLCHCHTEGRATQAAQLP